VRQTSCTDRLANDEAFAIVGVMPPSFPLDAPDVEQVYAADYRSEPQSASSASSDG
jgi:hypothetical protein